MRLPRENFTVAILANSLPGAPGADPGQLAHLVTEICLGEKLGPRPTHQVNPGVSPDVFDPLVGRYDYGVGVMTVTKEGRHLYAQLAGQPRIEIFPKSDTEFFWKVVDAQVTFVKDDQGKVTKAVHHQSGQTINAPRLEDLKEANVDPATYDAFVGKYDYGEGKAIMTVSREGGRLFAQLGCTDVHRIKEDALDTHSRTVLEDQRASSPRLFHALAQFNAHLHHRPGGSFVTRVTIPLG
jgi:hypothetical protein